MGKEPESQNQRVLTYWGEIVVSSAQFCIKMLNWRCSDLSVTMCIHFTLTLFIIPLCSLNSSYDGQKTRMN